jgi:hypothetical protein
VAGLCLATSFFAFAAIAAVDAQAEVNDIINTLLKPAAQKGSDAIPLVTTDPAKACQLETEASDDVDQAYGRLQTLAQKMKAENRDPAPLQPLMTKIEQAIPSYHENKKAACSGELAQLNNDPVTAELTRKVGGYMKAYTDDVIASETALQQKDKTTYCQRLTDGRVQLNGLSAYIVTWRKAHPKDKQGIAAMDSLANTVAGYQVTNDTKLKQCPAA